MNSNVTGIENLSKTLKQYQNEYSIAGKGLKLNTAEDVRQIANEIINTKDLRVLRLEGNTFSPEAAEALAKALEKHPEIERFIGNDIFTSRLKEEIPLALRSICNTFETIGTRLVEINMSDNAFGPIGLEALTHFFASPVCFTLKELRMHNNGLGPQGALKLASALERCYENSDKKFALKVFICGRNRLETSGIAIANALKKIGTLEEIQMPQNGIRPDPMVGVADALADLKELKILNLNDNTFTFKGCESMSKALVKLTNLEYINFGDCLLKSRGTLTIIDALQSHANLKELILNNNEIDAQTGVDIANKLIKNQNLRNSLKLLDLNGNNFGEDAKSEIQQILQPISGSLNTMSDDEGSEVDEEEEGEEEEESGEEEEDDEQEDNEDEDVTNRYGEMNLNNNTANTKASENVFAKLILNQKLKSTTTIEQFIQNPDLNALNQIDDATFKAYLESNQYDPSDNILRLLNSLAKLLSDGRNEQIVLKKTIDLLKLYFSNAEHRATFASIFLTYFGLLKSEDKKFQPVTVDVNLSKLIDFVFKKEAIVPNDIRLNISEYLKYRDVDLNSSKYMPKGNKEKLIQLIA